MEQSLATIAPAANQAVSTARILTAHPGRAGAARRSPGFGPLIVLGPISLRLLGLFASLILGIPEPHDALLQGELALEESAAIVGCIDARGRPFPQHLVSAALLAVSPGHVALVDDRGTLLGRCGEVAFRKAAHR